MTHVISPKVVRGYQKVKNKNARPSELKSGCTFDTTKSSSLPVVVQQAVICLLELRIGRSLLPVNTPESPESSRQGVSDDV